jgi:hypothetical protein
MEEKEMIGRLLLPGYLGILPQRKVDVYGTMA